MMLSTRLGCLASRFRRGLPILALAASVALCGCSDSGKGGTTEPSEREIVVFAAASLTNVMQEIGTLFEQAGNGRVQFNFAGSNALAQQIVAAPRADVFLSASERWMDHVESKGGLKAGTRHTFLSNRLVVVSKLESPFEPVNASSELCALSPRFWSMGNPSGVPAGRYSKAWMETISCGPDQSLWNTVSANVSPTPDVRSALGQALSLSDVIGVVYRTDYYTQRSQLKVVWQVPDSEGPKISYAAAVLAEAPEEALAEKFLDFLDSEEAKAVFEAAGFLMVNDAQ